MREYLAARRWVAESGWMLNDLPVELRERFPSLGRFEIDLLLRQVVRMHSDPRLLAELTQVRSEAKQARQREQAARAKELEEAEREAAEARQKQLDEDAARDLAARAAEEQAWKEAEVEAEKVREREEAARIAALEALFKPVQQRAEPESPEMRIALAKHREMIAEARNLLHEILREPPEAWSGISKIWTLGAAVGIRVSDHSDLLLTDQTKKGWLRRHIQSELLDSLEPGAWCVSLTAVPDLFPDVLKATLMLELAYREGEPYWSFDKLSDHVRYVGPVDLVGGVSRLEAERLVTMLNRTGADCLITEAAGGEDSPYLPFYRDREPKELPDESLQERRWAEQARREDRRQLQDQKRRLREEESTWKHREFTPGHFTVRLSAPATGQEPSVLAGRLVPLLNATAGLRGMTPAEVSALVERAFHISAQAIAEDVSQSDAVELKLAVEGRGGRVTIVEGKVRKGASRRDPIPSSVRREVWNRDGAQCVDCGSKESLEYDHIIPLSKGGSNTVRNIELRCESCNRGKAASI